MNNRHNNGLTPLAKECFVPFLLAEQISYTDFSCW